MVVESGEDLVEQFGAVGLVVVGGVLALAKQGWPEFDAGLEEGAGFADGFEGAVEFGWSGAVAVAEEAVVLAAEPGHARADRVGWDRISLLVKGFDLLGDGEVLVGNRAIGDLGIA